MALIEKLTAIGEAIRAKLETTDLIPLAEMPQRVEDIYSAGSDTGKSIKNKEWWNCLTNDNTRKTYDNGFRETDFRKIAGGFNPPYTIKPEYCGGMFYSCKGIKNITKNQFDVSNSGTMNTCFRYSDVEYVELLDTRKMSSFSLCFANCASLRKIGKFILKDDGTQTIVYDVFNSCPALEEITFEGKIGVSWSFVWCSKLTAPSIESIVAALSDIKSGQTLTFHNAVKQTYYNAHLNEYEDADTAWDTLCNTKPNWTISLV